MRARILISTVFVFAVVAPGAHAKTCRTVKACQAQVRALKAQNAKLKTQLHAAQSGVPSAVKAMTALQITLTVFPVVYDLFKAREAPPLSLNVPGASTTRSTTIHDDGVTSYTYNFWADDHAYRPTIPKKCRSVKRCRAQVAPLRAQGATLRRQLEIAKGGVTAAMKTMTPIEITFAVFPLVYDAFNAQHEAWRNDFLNVPYARSSRTITIHDEDVKTYNYDFEIDDGVTPRG